jgi:hypothetical protein
MSKRNAVIFPLKEQKTRENRPARPAAVFRDKKAGRGKVPASSSEQKKEKAAPEGPAYFPEIRGPRTGRNPFAE